MKQNDSHRSPTIPVSAISNAKYSLTQVRVTRIPRRHQSSINQSHYISTNGRQSKRVIHRTIRAPSSIVSKGKEITEFNGSLKSASSHPITHKHRYQSRSHITQSLVLRPNKVSPTLSANTHLRCHESLSVMEDRERKHVTNEDGTSIIKTTPLPPIEVTEHKDLVVNDSFRFGSRTHTVKTWDIELFDNHRLPSRSNNKRKKTLCGRNFCRPCSPLCAFLSFLAVALLLGTIATILATRLISANTTATNSTTSTTVTTITPTTTSTITTTSITTSTTTTTITTTTSTTTTTTTPPYCAHTCTGNHTNYGNATTCGYTCVDSGGFICQNSSTYCAGGTFSTNGTCDAGNGNGPCSSGYCCVYDNFNPSVPYLCMNCNAVG